MYRVWLEPNMRPKVVHQKLWLWKYTECNVPTWINATRYSLIGVDQ